MLKNRIFVRSYVNTIQLVVGDEALDPLNSRTDLLENVAGLLRDGLEFPLRQLTQVGISRSMMYLGMVCASLLYPFVAAVRTSLSTCVNGRHVFTG